MKIDNGAGMLLRVAAVVLVLIPLLAATFGAAAMFRVVSDRPTTAGFVGLGVFVVLTALLTYILVRVHRRPLLEIGSGEQVSPRAKRLFSGLVIGQTYLMLGVAAMVFFGVVSLKNWIGIVCFALGSIRIGLALVAFTPRRLAAQPTCREAQADRLKWIEGFLDRRSRTIRPLLLSSILAVPSCIGGYYLLGYLFFTLGDVLGILFLLWCTPLAQLLERRRLRQSQAILKERLARVS